MTSNRNYTETHDFLLSIIGSVPYGIITIDLEGYITIANNQAIELLGLHMNVNELVESEVLSVFNELTELHQLVEECLTRGRVNFDLEELYINNKYLACVGRKVLDGMILTFTDITSIKESEVNTLNSLLEGQELERKRLAQEIHDGIGPTLSTIKMNLAGIEDEMGKADKELGNKFRNSYKMIDEVANDIRAISHNLLPKILTDFGLEEALRTLCEKVEESKKLKVAFISSGFHERLDVVTELALYRVCQELINNTIKYAEAEKTTIQLLKRHDEINLMYEDDGKGFYPDAVSGGLGMSNIQNRIKALAGEVDIDSQPGRGMTANIFIPLTSKL